MPDVPDTVFPDWQAILKLADPELADFIMRGDADRHRRMSLGWPGLFTTESPYSSSRPILLANLQREFGALDAEDRWERSEIWDILGRRLEFPIFVLCNADRRRSRGNFGVSEANFASLLTNQGTAIRPFHGGNIEHAGTRFLICIQDVVGQFLVIAPASRFDLTE